MKKTKMTLVIVALIAILAVFITFLFCSNDAPTISISEDGYWVINGEKTDVSAKGEKGDKGDKGDGSSSADENPQGLQFYPQDDGTYVVSCGDAKYLSNIVIPATYKGGAVVGIDKLAFNGCTNLKSIVIPDSVTSIGKEAFSGCTGLTSIEIGDSVTSVGDYAFGGCTGLTDVYITDIDAWCNISFSNYISNPMYNGANLYLNGNLVTEVTVPDTVKSLGYTFVGCTSIVSVTIPDSVTSIGSYAFRGCTGLTSIVIPDSVTSIDYCAFVGCDGLTDVYYTGTEAEWAKISIGSYGNDDLKNVTIHYNYVPEN